MHASRPGAAAGLLVLLTPALALGHAEWQPAEVAAGSTSALVLFVPPEKDGVENVRIDLELVQGFRADACDPPPGWTCDSTATVVSFVRRVGLASESRFGVELTAPRQPGPRVFPVTQTYDDGTGVRWSGPPGDEFEGAILRVTGSSAAPDRTAAPSGPSPSSAPRASRNPGSSSGPALVAAPAVPAQPSSAGTPAPDASSGAPVPAPGLDAPDGQVAPAPAIPRAPGRFLVQETTSAGGSIRDDLAVLAAGGLLLAAALGQAAAAVRRAGGRRAG